MKVVVYLIIDICNISKICAVVHLVITDHPLCCTANLLPFFAPAGDIGVNFRCYLNGARKRGTIGCGFLKKLLLRWNNIEMKL